MFKERKLPLPGRTTEILSLIIAVYCFTWIFRVYQELLPLRRPAAPGHDGEVNRMQSNQRKNLGQIISMLGPGSNRSIPYLSNSTDQLKIHFSSTVFFSAHPSAATSVSVSLIIDSTNSFL